MKMLLPTYHPLTALSAILLGLGVLSAPAAHAQTGPQRWEKAIQEFEAGDAKQPPARHGIVFVGSSSIRGWNLQRSFPDLPVINRGFGGSQLADSVYYADRAVLKHEPRVVVLYAGDNDIAAGKTAQQVSNDYQAFVARVHARAPKTRIVFIAIKPSIRRWELVDQMRQANRLVRQATEKDERLVFVDVDAPMLGDDARPRGEWFQKDGLHLSDAGYDLWASLVRPHLQVDEREASQP